MRTIEIDFDIHKLIEAERRSFEERPNEALRRLLKLPELPKSVDQSNTSGSKHHKPAIRKLSDSRSWQCDGVELPHGTLVRMRYNGREHTGQIENGKWRVEGNLYDSPSGAASAVAVTRKGRKTRLDGWIYWEAKRPNDSRWRLIDRLRPSSIPTIEELA
jgi:hypothetical protein